MADDLNDDATIADDDGLLRRVPPWPSMFLFDEQLQTVRASSACFKDRDGSNELSVEDETSAFNSQLNYQVLLANHPNYGFARFKAGFARTQLKNPQKIVKQATEESRFHTLVVGEKTKPDFKLMAKTAVIVLEPEVE